jgi:hypothetical protein
MFGSAIRVLSRPARTANPRRFRVKNWFDRTVKLSWLTNKVFRYPTAFSEHRLSNLPTFVEPSSILRDVFETAVILDVYSEKFVFGIEGAPCFRGGAMAPRCASPSPGGPSCRLAKANRAERFFLPRRRIRRCGRFPAIRLLRHWPAAVSGRPFRCPCRPAPPIPGPRPGRQITTASPGRCTAGATESQPATTRSTAPTSGPTSRSTLRTRATACGRRAGHPRRRSPPAPREAPSRRGGLRRSPSTTVGPRGRPALNQSPIGRAASPCLSDRRRSLRTGQGGWRTTAGKLPSKSRGARSLGGGFRPTIWSTSRSMGGRPRADSGQR